MSGWIEVNMVGNNCVEVTVGTQFLSLSQDEAIELYEHIGDLLPRFLADSGGKKDDAEKGKKWT